MNKEAAEQAVREGRPDLALAALQDAVRAKPGDAKLRVFLFQLLCVEGQWQRALNQLNVCAEMDPAALAMREMYRGAVSCEALRAEVFSGHRAPMLFGEPEPWLALLIESMLRAGAGEPEASASLRQRSFDAAPASSGTLDGTAFEWIADADPRLGPVLEAMVNGRYYWVPFTRLTRVVIEEPADLRDFVWIPANLQFSNGGETPALIPVRYPGSEKAGDGALALARKTEWQTQGNDLFTGLGQRLLATDAGEYPLLQCREILFNAAASE
ncbi:MAG: type VI secretion system accessory protein TagJ [Panacagrimonas sp.]